MQHTLRRLSETIDLKDALSLMSGVGMPDPPQVRRVLWLAGWLLPAVLAGWCLLAPAPALLPRCLCRLCLMQPALPLNITKECSIIPLLAWPAAVALRVLQPPGQQRRQRQQRRQHQGRAGGAGGKHEVAGGCTGYGDVHEEGEPPPSSSDDRCGGVGAGPACQPACHPACQPARPPFLNEFASSHFALLSSLLQMSGMRSWCRA